MPAAHCVASGSYRGLIFGGRNSRGIDLQLGCHTRHKSGELLDGLKGPVAPGVDVLDPPSELTPPKIAVLTKLNHKIPLHDKDSLSAHQCPSRKEMVKQP